MITSGARGDRRGRGPKPAPVSSAEIERYRLRLSRETRPQLPGPHLVRRRGQSLEFREFRVYVPGDDIRYLDWRASERHGPPREYLVRTFEHETQTRIVISVDARATMSLPQAAPKLDVACWMTEALAYVAARSGDRVCLHDLFGAARMVTDLGPPADRVRVRQALGRLLATTAPRTSLARAALQAALPPASVWFVLTDLYFDRDEDVDRLVSCMREAQQGARWVILVELDSWPHERGLLGRGLRRIDGPLADRREPRLEVTEETIRTVEHRLERLRQGIDRARGGGYSHIRWSWPDAPAPQLEQLFRRWFFFDPVIRRLTRKDATS